ncbi:MAG: GYD domain-containing protein [Deltaproteobacteria bacterium]|nr:GYD domain-containing protein [Deltaproteobacteria bacterium]
MATYFMFGSYSSEAINAVSASRSKKAEELVKGLGGEIKSMYALLGEYDLVLIVELPNFENAVKASVALTRQTGIAFSTMPAIAVADFDKMIASG